MIWMAGAGIFSTIEIYWKRKGRIIILPPEVRRDIRNRRTAKKRICHMDMISKKFGRERYRPSFWEHLLSEMNIITIQMLTVQEIFSLFLHPGIRSCLKKIISFYRDGKHGLPVRRRIRIFTILAASSSISII